jgi:hypothetical protein
MTEWTDAGNKITTQGDLLEFIALVRSEAHHMRVGLSRAAWGALNNRAWDEEPAEGETRPNDEDILRSLDMTVTPAGTPAKAAALRNSLASLIAALDTVDHAALTAWLAHITAHDPDRSA